MKYLLFLLIQVRVVYGQWEDFNSSSLHDEYLRLPEDYKSSVLNKYLHFDGGNLDTLSNWRLNGSAEIKRDHVELSEETAFDVGSVYSRRSIPSDVFGWRVEVLFSATTTKFEEGSQGSPAFGLFLADNQSMTTAFGEDKLNYMNGLLTSLNIWFDNQRISSSLSPEPSQGFLVFDSNATIHNVDDTCDALQASVVEKGVLLILQFVEDSVTIAIAWLDEDGNVKSQTCISDANAEELDSLVKSDDIKIGVAGLNQGCYSEMKVFSIAVFELFPIVTTTTSTTTTTTTAPKTTPEPTTTTPEPITTTVEPLTTTVEPSTTTVEPSTTTTEPSTTTTEPSTTTTEPSTTTTEPSTTTLEPSTTTLEPSTTVEPTTTPEATTIAELVSTSPLYTLPPWDDNSVPLPDLPEESPIPKFFAGELVKVCSDFSPNISAPPNDGDPTYVHASFIIDNFLGISDVEETISITATLFLQWVVDTCSAKATASDLSTSERVFVAQASEVWKPIVLFRSSANDVYMKSDAYGDDLVVAIRPTTPFRVINFYWTRMGIYTSKCRLMLTKFPFDKQTCNFTFSLQRTLVLARFGGCEMEHPTYFSPSSEWILEEMRQPEKNVIESTAMKSKVSSVTFFMRFSRKPDYFAFNLLAPVLALILLELGAFLLPPNIPERSTFAVTILLALTVTQSDVLKMVPKSSQRILLSDYILLLQAFAGLCTIYDMAICAFCHLPIVGRSQVTFWCLGSKLRITIARFADVFAFSCACIGFAGINYYAVSIIFELD